MRLGITLPQGCDREYLGLAPAKAWQRTVDIARQCESAGFELLWLYDHLQVDPPVIEAPIFEPLTELAGLASVTRRARLGHLVLAAAYRNPALTAKAISTVDVISGGRAVLGVGAGWKEDEWVAYGYGFPDVKQRLAILEDSLEIMSRMLQPGRATYRGQHAHVIDAVHEPVGADGPVPILVGGNGPRVTWRLAARFAAELNLDGMSPAQVREALPVVHERCEEIGRDPATLGVSVHLWGPPADVGPGRERTDRLLEYAETGIDLAIVQGFVGTKDQPALEALIEDCAATGFLSP